MTKKQIFSAGFGVLLLAALIVWIGPETFYQQFIALKWVLPILVLMGLAKHLLRTWSWREALLAEGLEIGFMELLRVRIGSQAVAYLSSMGMVVSEPLKPWLLRRVASYKKTLPPTVVEAAVYWFVSLFVMTVGTFVTINVLADTHNALTLSLICLASFVGIVLLLFTRISITGGLQKLITRRFPKRTKWIDGLRKASDMESQIRSFRIRHPRTVADILGIHLLVQVVMFTEVWLVLSAVGAGVGILYLLAIEAASRMVKIMSVYLPGRVGADEAGGAGAFLLLGLNPAAGLTLAIARRIQALCWTALGLAWLSRGGTRRGQESTASNTAFSLFGDNAVSQSKGKEPSDAGPRLVAQDR